MTDLPAIPGLPKPPEIKITDPLEIGIFSFGNAGGFLLVHILTGDPAIAAYLAPVIGTVLWAAWRIAATSARALGSRRQQTDEMLRQHLIARVRLELSVLHDANQDGDLGQEALRKLRSLYAIENQQLYDIKLMQDVLRQYPEVTPLGTSDTPPQLTAD